MKKEFKHRKISARTSQEQGSCSIIPSIPTSARSHSVLGKRSKCKKKKKVCSVRQQKLLGSIEITINREHVFYSTTFCTSRFAILYIKYTSSVHEKRSFCSLTSIGSKKNRKKQNIIQATRIISSLWNFNFYSKNISKDIEKYEKEKLYNLKIKFDFQIQFMVIFKCMTYTLL